MTATNSSMIQPGIDAVAKFMHHMRINFSGSMIPDSPSYVSFVHQALQSLELASKLALNEYKMHGGHLRDLRFHLEAEETCERLRCLIEGDEVGYLDGFADSLYVMFGTCVSFDLPGDAAFQEVHKSNMTKQPRGTLGCPRLSDKGSAFVPPDLKGVLHDHRLRQH